jgi:hypothetical protein
MVQKEGRVAYRPRWVDVGVEQRRHEDALRGFVGVVLGKVDGQGVDAPIPIRFFLARDAARPFEEVRRAEIWWISAKVAR